VGDFSVDIYDLYLDGTLIRNAHYFTLKNAGINMVRFAPEPARILNLSLAMEVS
jgi:hypothetical protein